MNCMFCFISGSEIKIATLTVVKKVIRLISAFFTNIITMVRCIIAHIVLKMFSNFVVFLS